MMDNCCAPQWADFTRSPQVVSDNYFEVEHKVHEPQIHIKTTLKSNLPLPSKEESICSQPMSETKFEDSLEQDPEPESPDCTNVAYFIPHDNKKHSAHGGKQDSLSKAMKDLKLDDKSSKVRQTWEISISELTSGLKVSTAEHKKRAAVPERIKKLIRMSEMKNTVLGKSSGKNVQGNDTKKKNKTYKVSTKAHRETMVKSKDDNCTEDNFAEKRLSFKIVTVPRRQSNLFQTKRCSMGKSQPKVLTCQYRRRSLMKYRRCSNQFISLAEAVSKFQNGTPQRFRTMSNRDMKPGPLMKLKRSPLKLTYPVSPALRCKQRTRQTTILSQQEREQLELEEMKKHYVKANPVPINILKGPSVLKKVVKKPITVTEEFRLTQPKKTRHTTGPHMSAQPNTNSKEQKNIGTIARSNSATNVVKKECAETATKVAKPTTETTNPIPFSFEARNKEFQMKKEEKLKTLHDQEVNQAKAEFHARPAPKFSRPTNPVKEQTNKKRVVLCPFSFEERNKSLAKKKEELLKQMQEQNKKARVFHANPVPSFKPVTVHGISKEKEKAVNCSKDIPTRQTKSCNDQENKQPNIIDNDIIRADTKKKETKQRIVNNETDKKQCKNSTEEVDDKNDKLKTNQKKILKFELNTDKRAKERHEFEEKIRKREQELEAKRQEEEKNKLLKEKMERAELRKLAEVKATPMPVYKPLVVAKSAKPATSPKSPAWASRTKSKGVS